jgi:PAS domain S-box-containing protein
MNGHLALIGASGIASLGLGAAVLSRQPRGKINRYFALFSFAVTAWTLSNAFAVAEFQGFPDYIWPRFAFASASIIPIAFLAFATVFPTTVSPPPTRVLAGFALTASIFFVGSLTPLIVQGATIDGGALRLVYGPLHRPFAIYFVSCLGLSLYLLLKKRRVLSGFQRLQVRYLFLGVLTAAIGATATNLLIPLVVGTSYFSRYGPLFGLVMIAMIAHSIIRHRLMNLRLVLRQGAVYLIAATIAGAVFAAIIIAGSRLVGEHPRDVSLPGLVIVALAIALAFQPLKNSLQGTLDRYLYRESYNYQTILREASRTINGTLDLNSLLQYLCDLTNRTLRPDLVMLFTKDSRDTSFALAARLAVAENDYTDTSVRLLQSSPLPSFLVRSGRPLLRDELGRTLTDPDAVGAIAELSLLGGDVAIPMVSEAQLIGFLVLGTKLSGDAYFSDDIELLTTFSNQAATAINNAQLYRRVLLVNEYIENILRTMDSGVVTVDANGQVAIANATAESLTGLPRTTLKALTVDTLPHPLSSQLRRTLSDGQPQLQIEATLPNSSGQPLPIVCSTSALRDERGAINGALVVFSDLSRLKALESEKRRAERLAAFGTLVSGIAHEIKNPLVAIKTFAELLPERFQETDFREDFAKVVITEIDRIDDLVARLRGLAIPSPQPGGGAVDIREPISDTLALLRAQLEQAHITVTRDFQDPNPFIVADVPQLKQLFLNLFINAIEAIGRDGELTVRVTRRLGQESAWIVADISDTGAGIPDAIRANIFNPFFTTKPRGSGLGLAICRGIVDAHRGTIRAEARSDRHGTAMIVEFPSTIHDPAYPEQSVLTH